MSLRNLSQETIRRDVTAKFIHDLSHVIDPKTNFAGKILVNTNLHDKFSVSITLSV